MRQVTRRKLSASIWLDQDEVLIDDKRPIFVDTTGEQHSLAEDFDFSDCTLQDFLLQLESPSAAVLVHNSEVVIAVDRVRTIPLFYAIEKRVLLISDDASWIRDQLHDQTINVGATVEFFQSGFVGGDRTLYDGIKTIQAGEYVKAVESENGWSLSSHQYFSYFTADHRVDDPEEVLLEKLDTIVLDTFSQLIEKYKNATFVVPLSGGMDSRFIVHTLKRLRCKNVLCYSFGTPENRDCLVAKEIAKQVEYPWYFVQLTPKLWREAYNSDLYTNLKRRFSGFCSILSNQEFPAMYQMTQNGIMPERSVVVPGHTGDFISGGHIPEEIFERPPSMDTVADYVFKKHYLLWKTIFFPHRKKEKSYIEKHIRQQFEKFSFHTHRDVAAGIEFFDWHERQSKFIVQFVTVYRVFGFPFELPLWSNEIIDFFVDLPLSLKMGKKFYLKYLYETDYFDLFRELAPSPKRNSGEQPIKKEKLKSIRNIKRKVYNDWFYKMFFQYFQDDLNYYSPFGIWRVLKALGMHRHPNSFFVQDFLEELAAGKI